MAKVRILLADDHTIVRKGIRSLLDDVHSFEVVGEAEDGRDAVTQAEQLHPDVILMDHTMPRLNGLEATRMIRKRLPDAKILILTMHNDEEYILQFLQAGADGYLVKQSAPTELVQAIQAVSRGESFLSPSVSRTVIDEYLRRATTEQQPNPVGRLTSREREVLQLIAEGLSTGQIAEALHISDKTVRVHRMNLMQKVEIDNVAELTRFAIRNGIV